MQHYSVGRPLDEDEVAGALAVLVHCRTTAQLGVSLASAEEGLVRLCTLNISHTVRQTKWLVPCLIEGSSDGDETLKRPTVR